MNLKGKFFVEAFAAFFDAQLMLKIPSAVSYPHLILPGYSPTPREGLMDGYTHTHTHISIVLAITLHT